MRFEQLVTLCLTTGRTAMGSSFPGQHIKLAATSAPSTREQNWPSNSQGPEEAACVMLGIQHEETVTRATPLDQRGRKS